MADALRRRSPMPLSARLATGEFLMSEEYIEVDLAVAVALADTASSSLGGKVVKRFDVHGVCFFIPSRGTLPGQFVLGLQELAALKAKVNLSDPRDHHLSIQVGDSPRLPLPVTVKRPGRHTTLFYTGGAAVGAGLGSGTSGGPVVGEVADEEAGQLPAS